MHENEKLKFFSLKDEITEKKFQCLYPKLQEAQLLLRYFSKHAPN